MAETSTVARPYAQALFELARAQQQLAQWSDVLAHAAAVARDPTMAGLIGSPRVDRQQLAGLFIEVCGGELPDTGRNLLRLLAENRRLAVLPEIARQFEVLRAEAEGITEAQVISAQPVDAAQQQRIAAALQARLGREVTLTCTTDPSLLGGAVIRAGDLVIDGSVKGKLTKLISALNH